MTKTLVTAGVAKRGRSLEKENRESVNAKTKRRENRTEIENVMGDGNKDEGERRSVR